MASSFQTVNQESSLVSNSGFIWLGKSWNFLKMHYPGLESHGFSKNGRGHAKAVEFYFLVQIFVLFENWKLKHSPSHQAKIWPKKAGIFSIS